MPRLSTISFGVEFEFDVIEETGDVDRRPSSHYWHTIEGWDYQNDPTTCVELRSPVWRTIEGATESIKREFRYWIRHMDSEENRCVPYPYNRTGRSLGQHIHIGKPNRRLTSREKDNISTCVAKVYPFLASIHAQPIPSRRGLTSQYCYRINPRNNLAISRDHYAEISASHLGTVEFRLFDANIPQVSLLCAWVMQRIAQRHMRSNSELDGNRYLADRESGLRHGLVGLDLPTYLREIRELTESSEIPETRSLKEQLFMASRYYMNPFNAKKTLQLNDYEYFKSMCQNPDQYLENILGLDSLNDRERIELWIAESERVENLDQLIGMAEATRRTVTTTLLERPEQIPTTTRPVVRGMTRSQAREALQLGRFTICRINEVPNCTPQSVCRRIAEILTRQGDGLTNGLSPRDILEANQRFYVFNMYTRREIVGTIAVRMRTGEISSLVVDRRFRRLGIARRLLEHVLSLDVHPQLAHVRIGNDASLRLFQSLGFKEVSRGDRAILLRRG